MSDQMPVAGSTARTRMALAVAVVVLGAGAAQWVAVHLEAALQSRTPPALGVIGSLGLYLQADPSGKVGFSVNPILHWVIVVLIVAAASAAALVLQSLWARRTKDPQRLPGLASAVEIGRIASAKALMKRASVLRPTKGAAAALTDLGFFLGSARGQDVWMSVEDSVVLVGPSRSGKGYNFVVPMLSSAPGAVVTTSTRADNLSLTMRLRERTGGALYVFDPAGGAAGVGHALRWSPLSGCEDTDVVLRRMASLVPPGAFGGTENGGHWEAKAREVAQGLFHAAALGGKTVEDVWRWVVAPDEAREAVEIIRNDPRGDRLWAASLNTILDADREQRDREWGTARTVLKYLDSDSIRKWLTPTDDDPEFDIPRFLLERGTLYLIGDEAAATQFEQIIVALFEEISHVAQGIAAASPGARLDPPVQFILDEAANFKIPSLPKLISYAGGSGITVVVVLQSISQARAAWGADGQRAMWGASSLKIVLPGGADPDDLRDLETLIGQVERVRRSVTDGDNSSSYSYSQQYEAILQAAKIRTLPFGTALIFFRQAPPIVAKLRPWPKLPVADELAADKKAVDEQLRSSSRFAHLFDPQA